MSSPTAREQIVERARLNNWQVAEYHAAVTVSKAGKSIAVRFSSSGVITQVGTTGFPQVTGKDRLGKILRLMGTLPIG